MDTIYALATAQGKAGVAIVRISGPRAKLGVEPMVGSFGPARKAVLRNLRDRDRLLDQALVLQFEAEHSFTGEEVVELQLHGSPAIIAAVLDSLSRIDGFRIAEPGEFTRRALSNGKLDLAQVEGLADLLAAETEAQRVQAMRIFEGALKSMSQGWRSSLLRAVALLEATLDFADEDVPVDVFPEVRGLIEGVLAELNKELDGYAVSERVRNGFEVAIVGAPNAGKSTLLNRLAGRKAALTSEYAGTTRDVIEVRMDLGGLPVILMDTAGLRDATDPVEILGIAQATERAAAADLRIFLISDEAEPLSLQPQDGDIVVKGKGDLGGRDGLSVSGLTGLGVDELVALIGRRLEAKVGGLATINRHRQWVSVQAARDALVLAQGMVSDCSAGAEIASDAVRCAVDALSGIIGHIGVEDILGEIFSSFCIGK